MTDVNPTPAPTPLSWFEASSSPAGSLPPRPVYWLRALRALARIARADEFSSEAAREFGAALEGDEGEHSFREFLHETGAQDLLTARPDLAAALDDHQALAAMPKGSLGRAYLALAAGDEISVKELALAANKLPSS